MSKSVLIIFVKNPELGKAKTRLAKTIGKEKALSIYQLLLQRTHDIVSGLKIDVQVHYSSFIDQEDLWENDLFSKHLQTSGDLGEKMESAFQNAFDEGYESVGIIGSDCYDLDQDIISEAFEALHLKDAVIGPSKDGGYYLLGMNKLDGQVFKNKQWSTSSVFTDTIKDFEYLGRSFHCLPTLSDVDVEADLGNWAFEILNNE